MMAFNEGIVFAKRDRGAPRHSDVSSEWRSGRAQQRCAIRAHPVAHLALEQLARPDAEAAGAVEHPATPGALVDQSVRGTWIGEPVEVGQWQLHMSQDAHVLSEQHNRG